jgi:lipoprotein-anchoring transpeptidase ErfK/SrfK
MMPHRPVGSRAGAPAMMRVVLLVASGLIACGPVGPKPNREAQAQAPVPAPSVASDRTSPYLVIRLKARRLDVMKDDAMTPVESFPIAVGRAARETPTGRFRVEEMIEYPDYQQIDPNDRSRILKRIPPGPANPLGERWIGFIRGEGWTIGIHGTPHPELLGRAVSGGCIRMRNADVVRVYEKVELGTTVIVDP